MEGLKMEKPPFGGLCRIRGASVSVSLQLVGPFAFAASP